MPLMLIPLATLSLATATVLFALVRMVAVETELVTSTPELVPATVVFQE
jgi:hypothetical protein